MVVVDVVVVDVVVVDKVVGGGDVESAAMNEEIFDFGGCAMEVERVDFSRNICFLFFESSTSLGSDTEKSPSKLYGLFSDSNFGAVSAIKRAMMTSGSMSSPVPSSP